MPKDEQIKIEVEVKKERFFIQSGFACLQPSVRTSRICTVSVSYHPKKNSSPPFSLFQHLCTSFVFLETNINNKTQQQHCTTMTTINLSDIRDLQPSEVVSLLSGIYEHSSWVAERAFMDENSSSSLESINNIFQSMKQVVESASVDEKLKLLREHPDLCTRASCVGKLTNSSREEQSKAGLDRLTPEELSEFTANNAQYREKFGFPFILAVRNATKHTVLGALRSRVKNSYETEFHACLAQVHKIAWMRLIQLITPEKYGFLTCHVLDTASGSPAQKMSIELFRVCKDNNNAETMEFVSEFQTNDDGRLEGGPALKGEAFKVGVYQWVFHVGDYFATKSNLLTTCGTPFLDKVPVRFGIDDPESHYHVPLLVSPYSYSTYRGS